MATRPAWTVQNEKLIRKEFDFQWNGGFAITQKQKNITALHQAVQVVTGENSLEVSSKSMTDIGRNLSAFHLKLFGVYLENVFQSAKKYENGGPYLDMLDVHPKDAKKDERHLSSGKLLAFVHDGLTWPLVPRTVFYDYIYVSAVVENFGWDLDLSMYAWFTDIEFNPSKSINCQARSAALYKLIQQTENTEILDNRKEWIRFHEEHVLG